MSRLKIYIFSGKKTLAEWSVGDSPLTLRVQEENRTLLDLSLSTPHNSENEVKPNSSQRISQIAPQEDDFTMPLPIGGDSPELQAIISTLSAADQSNTTPSRITKAHEEESESLAPPELLQSLQVSMEDFNDTDISQVYEATFSLPHDDVQASSASQISVPKLEFWQLYQTEWSKIETVEVGAKMSIFALRVWYQRNGELLISGDDNTRIVGIHSNGDEQLFQCIDGFCVTPRGLPIVFQGEHRSYCLRPVKGK